MTLNPRFRRAAKLARMIPKLKKEPVRKRLAIHACIRELLAALRP